MASRCGLPAARQQKERYSRGSLTAHKKLLAALFHLLRTFIKHAASGKPTASSETHHTLVTTYLNYCPQRGASGPSCQNRQAEKQLLSQSCQHCTNLTCICLSVMQY